MQWHYKLSLSSSKIIGSYHAASSSISGGTNLQFWRVCSKIWPTLSNFSCKHYRIESWYQPFKIYPTWRCKWMPLEYAFLQVVGIIEWDHFDPSGACSCQSISNFIESIFFMVLYYLILIFIFIFLIKKNCIVKLYSSLTSPQKIKLPKNFSRLSPISLAKRTWTGLDYAAILILKYLLQHKFSVPHQMLHQSSEDQQEGLPFPLQQIHKAKPMQVALPS